MFAGGIMKKGFGVKVLTAVFGISLIFSLSSCSKKNETKKAGKEITVNIGDQAAFFLPASSEIQTKRTGSQKECCQCADQALHHQENLFSCHG